MGGLAVRRCFEKQSERGDLRPRRPHTFVLLKKLSACCHNRQTAQLLMEASNFANLRHPTPLAAVLFLRGTESNPPRPRQPPYLTAGTSEACSAISSSPAGTRGGVRLRPRANAHGPGRGVKTYDGGQSSHGAAAGSSRERGVATMKTIPSSILKVPIL